MKELYKNLKLRAAFAIISAVLVIALLGSYIAGTTIAKYRSRINGYTNITPASFHAMLTGGESSESLTEKWQSGSSAALFGKEVSLSNLQPGGEPDVIPFSLTNSTAEDKVSSVDIIYGLSLRTTGNLPLVFTLMRKVDSSAVTDKSTINSDGWEVYTTGTDCLIEHGDSGDAPTYLYSLYLVHNPGLEDEWTESVTRTFTLEGGKISADEYKLIIDWPITEGAYGKSTADSSYMKETDVIQLVADLVSSDRRDEYIGGGVVFPVPVVPDDHGNGLFVFYPSAGNCYTSSSSQYGIGNTDYTYRYKFTNKAFSSVETAIYGTTIGDGSVADPAEVGDALPLSLSESATSSAYRIRVTNGNSILDENGDPISDMTTRYVDMRMRIYFPLTKDTINSDGELTVKFDILTQFPDGSVLGSTLSMYSSKRIAKYDLSTGEFEDLGLNRFQEIGALVNSDDYDCNASRYRYYYTYDFAMLENGEKKTYDTYYDFQLQNFNNDGTRKLDYLSFILVTDLSPSDMAALPLYNEFYIEATAMYRKD